MVLDPFSALSLAGNIVQFVDFGLKIVKDSNAILHNAKGISPFIDETQSNIWRLQEYSRFLYSRLALDPSGTPESWEEKELRSISQDCAKAADELLLVLGKVSTSGASSKWQALHQATRAAMKRRDIDALATKLDSYRSQISLYIVGILKYKQSLIASKLDELSESSKKYGMDAADKFDSIRSEIVENSIRLSRVQDAANESAEMTTKLVQNLLDLSTQGHDLAKQSAILESLWFSTVEIRHDQIAEAHKKTLEWIFNTEKTKFLDWLTRGDSAFWISGKAGSGKSTLMKFIADHPKTQEALKTWAGDKQLITASFYFWSSGTDLQKSLRGLLQSLLYEILRKHPEFMPTVVPLRWDGDHRFQHLLQRHMLQILAHQATDTTAPKIEPWSLKELKSAFTLLRQQTTLPTRICFFIDGLDEYDGDHAEAAELLKNLFKSTDIKICVASRAWNVFRVAFGKNLERTLLLEELTKEDIEAFVKTKLVENETFAEACTSDSKYPALINDIVAKAEGVFLWVRLAVQSLLNGITNADTVEELRKRLEELPPDLEKLFEHMLDSIQERYKMQARKIFFVAMHADKPLLLMSVPDEDIWLKNQQASVASLTQADIVAKLRTSWQRLNARCNGLMSAYCTDSRWTIEEALVNEEAPALLHKLKVDFIHRSAKEFLKRKSLDQMDSEDVLGKPRNPYHDICYGLLQTIQCLRRYEGTSVEQLRSGLFNPIIELIEYAEKSEQFCSRPETEILDNLARTLREGHPKLFHEYPEDSTESTPVELTVISSKEGVTWIYAATILWHSFLAFVACFGPFGYMKQKIEIEELSLMERESLSDWLYVASVDHFFGDARIREPLKIASLLIQRYGLNHLQHRLPYFRMFWFANSGGDIAEPWGQNPRDWSEEKQKPTLLDGYIFLYRQNVWSPDARAEFLNSILNAGADLNIIIEGLCLWIEAFMGGPGRTDTLAAFLEHGADPNMHCTASTFGVRGNCPARVHGGDPDTPWTLYLNWMFQIWHKAPELNKAYNAAVAELFLKAGASTSAQFRTRGCVVEIKTVSDIVEVLLMPDAFKALRTEYFPKEDRRWWPILGKISPIWLQVSAIGKWRYGQHANSWRRTLGIPILISVAMTLAIIRLIGGPSYLVLCLSTFFAFSIVRCCYDPGETTDDDEDSSCRALR